MAKLVGRHKQLYIPIVIHIKHSKDFKEVKNPFRVSKTLHHIDKTSRTQGRMQFLGNVFRLKKIACIQTFSSKKFQISGFLILVNEKSIKYSFNIEESLLLKLPIYFLLWRSDIWWYQLAAHLPQPCTPNRSCFSHYWVSIFPVQCSHSTDWLGWHKNVFGSAGSAI